MRGSSSSERDASVTSHQFPPHTCRPPPVPHRKSVPPYPKKLFKNFFGSGHGHGQSPPWVMSSPTILKKLFSYFLDPDPKLSWVMGKQFCKIFFSYACKKNLVRKVFGYGVTGWGRHLTMVGHMEKTFSQFFWYGWGDTRLQLVIWKKLFHNFFGMGGVTPDYSWSYGKNIFYNFFWYGWR